MGYFPTANSVSQRPIASDPTATPNLDSYSNVDANITSVDKLGSVLSESRLRDFSKEVRNINRVGKGHVATKCTID